MTSWILPEKEKPPSVVHPLHPQHLIFRFEGFRNALFFGKPLYQPRKQCFCLLIEVCKVIVQLAGSQQLGIQTDLVFADIPQMSLSPYADMRRSFFGQFQAGKICNPPIMIDFTYNPIIPADYKSPRERTSLRSLSLYWPFFIGNLLTILLSAL